jgi:uncharacterized protein (DUF302 family)
MEHRTLRSVCWYAILVFALALYGCGAPDPMTADRYEQADYLFSVLEKNVATSEELEKIVSIDHSRLAAEAGSVMPPAQVLIFSNPTLEAKLVSINPLTAIELPMRVLAYESVTNRSGRVTFNSFEYIRSRYGLGDLHELEAMFDKIMAETLQGIDREQISVFDDNTMQPDGIVTLDSPFDFNTTVERLIAAIDSQDDTVWFGKIDFQSRAKEQGTDVTPTLLLMFGAPAPGGKAMGKAPTLGLDAFCQKLLVWQDAAGVVRVSFNDLLAMAGRQRVPKPIALRIISYRLESTFKDALE